MRLLRQRIFWSGMAAIVAGGLLTAGAGPGAYAAAPQLSAARQIPGLNALNAGGNARVNSVSCGSPGNCAAAGAYTDASGNLLPFVADEKGGTWGPAQVIPRLGGQSSEAGSVSCPSAGNCAADGFAVSSTVDPFTVEETNGRWDLANTVNGMPELNVGQNAGASSISCATPGSCAAAGLYTGANGDHPSWISYVNSKGFWNPALAEPGTSGAGLLEVGAPPQITVSCGAPGNCAAGGWTNTNPTRTRTSFVLDEANFTWGAAHDVPGLATLTGTGGFSRLTAMSCKSAGSCTVTGQFSDSLRGTRAFVASEVNGTWGNAIDPDHDGPGPVRSHGDVRARAGREDLGHGHGTRRHARRPGHRHGGQDCHLRDRPAVRHGQLPALRERAAAGPPRPDR